MSDSEGGDRTRYGGPDNNETAFVTPTYKATEPPHILIKQTPTRPQTAYIHE